MVSASASTVTVMASPTLLPARVMETSVVGRSVRLRPLHMSIAGVAGFGSRFVAATRTASRAPWRTSRLLAKSHANSMIPNSKRNKIGAMTANSTRLAPLVLLHRFPSCHLRSLSRGYLPRGPPRRWFLRLSK